MLHLDVLQDLCIRAIFVMLPQKETKDRKLFSKATLADGNGDVSPIPPAQCPPCIQVHTSEAAALHFCILLRSWPLQQVAGTAAALDTNTGGIESEHSVASQLNRNIH